VPRRVSSPELIGRGPELTALVDALAGAADGRFAAVFVAGESGVGKSRLLHELERKAEARGMRTMAGECVTLAEGELPYAPIRSALRRLCAELDPQSFDELIGPGRAELARLLPQLRDPGEPVPSGPPDLEPLARARLFEFLLALLARLGDRTPVVLVIEDLHWADHSTLDFLGFLIANARRERLLLIGSYRTDELHRRHPLRAFLAQHERPPAVRLELRPFIPEELAAQLHAILDAAPEPAFVERLHERTEGNAFFTEELLAASREGTKLPASLREALLLRIEALPAATQHVLGLAAVHGRLVTHRLLAAAADLPEEELHDALRHAVNHHVLVRPDVARYAFRHALFAEALESDLLAGERMRLHLALARAIEQDPTVVEADGHAAAELCAHWLGAHRIPEALEAAVRAGDEAEQIYAFAEAGGHFERALELWERVDDAEQRAGMDAGALYARAAEAAHLGDDGPAAIRLVRGAIERVDPRADPYRAALLRERLGHYFWLFSGDDDAAQSAYQEAVELLPADEPRRERARVLAALGELLAMRGRTAESLERCEQAIAIARQTGGQTEEAHALDALGASLGLLGRRSEGIEHLRESLRMSDELGDLDLLTRAYVNLGEILDQDGRVEEAAELALAGAWRAGEVGMRDVRLLLEGEAATRLLKLGRLDEADRLTRTALEPWPSLGKLNQCAARARIEIQRGRLGDARPLLRAAEEAMPYARATWIEPLASARVELELLRGRPEDARRLAEQALELGDGDEHVGFTARLHALGARAGALLAQRARAAGDEPGADAAAARARELVDRIDRLVDPKRWRGAPPPEALAHRAACAAEAARAAGTDAAASWAALAERWALLALRLEEAYARLREAECHLLDGQRALAEDAVTAGRHIASECGAAWLEQDLDALARRGRLSSPREAEAGAPEDPARRLELTERELAVLELVALGMTNREIGEQLFMATKTASVHVSRIFTKLGVSSRVEAAIAAQRLGLVP
jgi:DNA-binding CsgD family transcriptional regulator/tetratricopeptide (TPR) repeat protein